MDGEHPPEARAGISRRSYVVPRLPPAWRDFLRSSLPRELRPTLRFEEDILIPGIAEMREVFAAGHPVFRTPLEGGGSRIFDFLGKVVLVLDEIGDMQATIPFHWVDDDGLLYWRGPIGGVDAAFTIRAFNDRSRGAATVSALRHCHRRETRVSGFLAKTGAWRPWTFGWFGAASADVEAVAEGGELTANWQLLGASRAHGQGVHVSALDHLDLSMQLSLQASPPRMAPQILFCAIAPGLKEVVAAGSSQSQSSNAFFHSATDALHNPRWYVFWEAAARTSILPLYIVTFYPGPPRNPVLEYGFSYGPFPGGPVTAFGSATTEEPIPPGDVMLTIECNKN
ncbi:hypothetical protein ACP4OV_021069 [Aristida adscensionis]